MPQIVKDFWAGLDARQRTVVVVAGVAAVLLMLLVLATGSGGWAGWLQGRL